MPDSVQLVIATSNALSRLFVTDTNILAIGAAVKSGVEYASTTTLELPLRSVTSPAP